MASDVPPSLAGSVILAPRSTGEIISDAVAALRRSFRVVFAIAVPFCAVDLFLREVAQTLLLQASSTMGDPDHADVGALVGAAPVMLAGLGFFLASFFVQQLLAGSVIAVGESLFYGRPVSVADALRRVGQRGAALIGTALLFMVLTAVVLGVTAGVPMLGAGLASVVLGMPVLVVAGVIIGVVGGLGLLIVLTLRWSLYAAVVMTEDRSLFRALARSSELTAGRGLPFVETPKFRLSVLFLVGVALSGVLQSLFLGPRLAMAFATGWSFSDGTMPGLAQMPLWFIVPFGLVEVLTNAAVIPFSGFLLCFFAFDLRVRYEGADLSSSPPSS